MTVRLLCKSGPNASTGTGLLWRFALSGGKEIVAIITNKHVVGSYPELNTTVSLLPRGSSGSIESDYSDECHHEEIALSNLQEKVIPHPDPNVDLCAIVIGQEIKDLLTRYRLRHVFCDKGWLADDETRKYFHAITPIAMIGYPNGLWDNVNNLPIVRSGKTATHAFVKWQGKPEFVIDTACFPGSSGSPVFLFEDGMYRSSSTGYSPGSRAILLGILWGGPVVSLTGSMTPQVISTAVTAVPTINTMMNLGYVISADEIERLHERILEISRIRRP